MLTILQSPRRYANLAEVMQFANDLALSKSEGPTSTGVFPVQFPHSAEEISSAWKTWVTEELMRFSHANRTITVPPGFLTDFASIPRVFRWLFSPNGAPHQVAAVAHDYLYSTAATTRKAADKAYLDICNDLGVEGYKAKAMYAALRVGGWAAWRSNRAKLLKEGPTWRFLSASTN